MEICFTINGVRHCYFIPIFQWPFNWWVPGPGPVNYEALVQDAFVLASVKTAVENVADASVRNVALRGISAAFEALEERAGEHASINVRQ